MSASFPSWARKYPRDNWIWRTSCFLWCFSSGSWIQDPVFCLVPAEMDLHWFVFAAEALAASDVHHGPAASAVGPVIASWDRPAAPSQTAVCRWFPFLQVCFELRQTEERSCFYQAQSSSYKTPSEPDQLLDPAQLWTTFRVISEFSFSTDQERFSGFSVKMNAWWKLLHL